MPPIMAAPTGPSDDRPCALDCSELGQTSRNALFMSNRETFREDPLLSELFKKLQNELKNHEGLIALDRKRYEQKIANATSDDDGINALEDLLSTDPALAEMFGSMKQGKVAAKTIASVVAGLKVEGNAAKFEGTQFPSYFRRNDGATSVEIELPQNDVARGFLLPPPLQKPSGLIFKIRLIIEARQTLPMCGRFTYRLTWRKIVALYQEAAN
jgi:hypothetical protein